MVLTPAMSAPGTLATPVPAVACEATSPNGAGVPGRRPNEDGYGNGELWTMLWPDGWVLFEPGGPGFVLPEGALSMKWPWWSSAVGTLSIEGQRVNGAGPPLHAKVIEGVADNDGFSPTYLLFPIPGCWQVTGHINGQRPTFVTEVVLVGEGPDWRPDEVP